MVPFGLGGKYDMKKKLRFLAGVIVVLTAGALLYQFILKDYVSWLQ
jgi:hypothetical protein